MITKYENYCLICGKPTENIHHLTPGKGMRKLADKDGLTMPTCFDCHEEIHRNKVALSLSRICGQLAYERWYIGDYGDAKESLDLAREEFRTRYGVSYL